MAYLSQGRYDAIEAAAALYAKLADRLGDAHARDNLALIRISQGRNEAATRPHHEHALAIALETGNRWLRAMVGNNLADTLLSLDRVDEARTRFAETVDVARAIHDPLHHGRALDGLGRCAQALGDLAEAAGCWRVALERYGRLGVPEAAETRRRIAGLRAGVRPLGPLDDRSRTGGRG